MNRINKILFLIIIIAGVLLFAAACDKFNFELFKSTEKETSTDIKATSEDIQADITADDTEPVVTEGVAETKLAEDSEATEKTTPTPNAIQPISNVDLPIYTVDPDSGETVAVAAAIPDANEVTPERIVDIVLDSLADQSIVIVVKDVKLQGDTIIVNFDKDKNPSTNLGSGYEASILDSIAQSLIDNLDDYNNVVYRIDDGPYVSGVFEYGIDDVYFSR